jgi:HEAT repeat protein
MNPEIMSEPLEICALRKEVALAQADCARLCEQQAAMPPGSSRAREMVLKWTRAVKYRDLLQARLEELIEKGSDYVVPVQGVEIPCQAMFEQMADEDPTKLLRLLADNELEPTMVSLAAEAAGQIAEHPERIEAILLGLLTHKEACVREGAVLGLAQLGTEAALTGLRRVRDNDQSQAVRMVADEALELLASEGLQRGFARNLS